LGSGTNASPDVTLTIALSACAADQFIDQRLDARIERLRCIVRYFFRV